MEKHIQKPKWEGIVSATLKGPTAGQLWPLLEDFCSVHKWLPSIDTCHKIDGVAGQPGCVRYCAKSSDGSQPATWATEKLLTIDQITRTFSYEIVESSMKFGSYVATMSVLPESDGCKIEWSFVMDPVEGLTQEGFVGYLDTNLEEMAKRMKEALKSSE